ncbi:MAG: hypothetical protein GEU93_02525 [Propionibacteriales bacterium]|nr:hypothetical protein [Propionibacteriales bacterium]
MLRTEGLAWQAFRRLVSRRRRVARS